MKSSNEEPLEIASDDEVFSKNVQQAEQSQECWQKRSHFLLAAIGAVVGVGNVWRFPLLAKNYGAGSFLLVYAILVVFEGIPLTYMELSIGRLMNTDIIETWRGVHPLASGVGHACCFVSLSLATYYAVPLVWCFHYFLYSFQSPLPWVFCPTSKTTQGAGTNSTLLLNDVECSNSSPSEYYWYRNTLKISSDISTGFDWNVYLFVLLAVIWIMVMLSVWKGIQCASQVLYFTVLFPYLGLFVLLLRTIFLEEVSEGLLHYITPEWNSLSNPQLWSDAGAQALFSLSIGAGVLPVFAGLNLKDGNSLIDAVVIVAADSFTSLLGALVVFAILSFRAAERLSECLAAEKSIAIVSNLTSSVTTGPSQQKCTLRQFLNEKEDGTGLAFINFTYTISYLPGASLFSALFFLMLFSLGFDSLVGYIIPCFQSAARMLRLRKNRAWFCTVVGCLLCCCVGAIFTQPSGEYIFQLLNNDSQDLSLLLLTLIECFMFGIASNIRIKARKSLGNRRLSLILEVLCVVIIPILLIAMIVTQIIRNGFVGQSYSAWDKDKGRLHLLPYPSWARATGYIFIFTPILLIAFGVVHGSFTKLKQCRNLEATSQ